MRRLTMQLIATLFWLSAATARADDWKPAAAPLMTRWAKDVSPQNALPEYPRPQMVRKDWLSLNGLWDIKLVDDANVEAADTKILVPFPIESALSGVMKHSDHMTYRRSFDVPAAWHGRHVLLHFGAVDWEATVLLNGMKLGTHRGGYDGFSFDITAALKPAGPQEIIVEVFDPTDKGSQPRGKQVIHPGGIMYTPTSGIWQTVWLEPVAEKHIVSLGLVPDVDGGALDLTLGMSVPEDLTVEAIASDRGKQVSRVTGPSGTKLKLAVPNAKLWTPDSPHLYDLRISLKSGGQTVDEVTSYFGMRKIAIGKDQRGVARMMLNGKFVFQVGPLDQGFWPDGIYTAPTDEALRWDIEMMKKLGFNCARKHVKVEPDRWYYWCDKLGLLVWQDMPAGDNKTPDSKKQFEVELRRLIAGRRDHPAIIMWVVFNEGWGQHDTEHLVNLVKELDPSRLVDNASGWTDKHCGDVVDMHNYPGPGSPKPEENRAAVLGEFGGLGLPVDGHTWSKKTWGYKGTQNIDDLTRGYEKLLTKAWALKDDPGLSACIYTQLTDVETECNGLLTYDREINKVIPDRAAAVDSGHLLRLR
ncbi:MAG TPA: glycoside hydrolase family 2 TIM barrel-domain containing protein [Pirellulales bacterium]|jgi:beta-galactosidase/beta-glucuronidase|nr:glycoside hydrolase family 2 TIM barrel-domain containing protein [Pirellulales bacterium]